MLPSHIRLLILQDHARLRIGLAAMHEAALEAQLGAGVGADEALRRLRAQTQRFASRFLRHLDLEESVLLPALRETDAWGDERAERVLTEHAAQRCTIEALVDGIDARNMDVTKAGAAIRRLAEDLAIDMREEEATILQEDLLRDDVVSLDAFGG